MIRELKTGLAVVIAASFFASPVFADRDSDDKDSDIQDKRMSEKGDNQNRVIRTEKRDTWINNIRVESREKRDDKRDGRDNFSRIESRDTRNDHEQDRIYKERGYRIDTRHNHNHYYPPRGYVIRTLPKRYRIVPYHGVNYYFYSGIWYRNAGVGFNVVVPPVGVIVPELPPYYTTIWAGATPYYYAGGVYYVWRPSMRAYEVVEAPADDEIDVASVPDELFAYPKAGQSEEQIAKDRYECYRWSVDQTGFDPTQPGGNVPVEQHESRRADYQRANTACLEGRDYSVR